MNDVDNYIESFSNEVKEKLSEIRELVKELAPGSTERICMGIPTFELNGKWLVHYAGFKKHIGFYPQPEGIIAFKERLTDYKTTKGTIQFPLNRPLPIELIREIVEFRIAEQMKH